MEPQERIAADHSAACGGAGPHFPAAGAGPSADGRQQRRLPGAAGRKRQRTLLLTVPAFRRCQRIRSPGRTNRYSNRRRHLPPELSLPSRRTSFLRRSFCPKQKAPPLRRSRKNPSLRTVLILRPHWKTPQTGFSQEQTSFPLPPRREPRAPGPSCPHRRARPGGPAT